MKRYLTVTHNLRTMCMQRDRSVANAFQLYVLKLLKSFEFSHLALQSLHVSTSLNPDIVLLLTNTSVSGVG